MMMNKCFVQFNVIFVTKYHNEYRISATDSANEALELIKELKLKNETVALFISDQRMPEMEGIIFLEKTKEIYPDAKLSSVNCLLRY